MCSTDNVGIAAVESATGANFSTIFSNFTKALVLSGTTDSEEPAYNFKTLDLQTLQHSGRGGILPFQENNTGSTITGTLYPFSINFDEWKGNFGTITLLSTNIIGAAFGTSR